MKLFEDGDPCFAPMLNALFAAFRGTAVMGGCEASATGTSRTVSITAGSVQINGEVIAVSAGSVTLDAGSTFDRYDLVSVNASGSKIVTKGTTKRKCPTQPANTCLLAIVFVPAGATVVTSGNVYDARMDALRLSVLNIDANKDWGGKNITNVGEISGLAFTPTISKMRFVHLPDPEKAPENVVASDLSEVSTYSEEFILAKTFPPAPTMGYVSHDISAVTVSMEIGYTGSVDAGEVDIRVNGVSKKVLIGPRGGWGERSADIPISPGDVITLWLRTPNPTRRGQLRNAKIYSMRHPLAAPSVAW